MGLGRCGARFAPTRPRAILRQVLAGERSVGLANVRENPFRASRSAEPRSHRMLLAPVVRGADPDSNVEVAVGNRGAERYRGPRRWGAASPFQSIGMPNPNSLSPASEPCRIWRIQDVIAVELVIADKHQRGVYRAVHDNCRSTGRAGPHRAQRPRCRIRRTDRRQGQTYERQGLRA